MNKPRDVAETGIPGLRDLLKEENDALWREDVVAARQHVSENRLDILEKARRANDCRAKLLVRALKLEAGAVGAVAIAVTWTILS